MEGLIVNKTNRQNALLRLMLACFLLYTAWPTLGAHPSGIANLFWGAWLVFFMFVAGSNLATLLRLAPKHVFETEEEKEIQFGKN